ncbi:LNS2-domain-containing protein, partial [Nadsonia fulvescens var. elongata DSM 6958]
MQYVGRAIGSVSKTWNSLNPATLSGAIDVIVVEHENGDLYCSPFHVRFGKFSLLQPSQKRVEICVNGEKTNIPMKLGEGGEAFFVFETDSEDIPSSLLTSPILSASSSPPDTTPRTNSSPHSCQSRKDEVEYLDLEKSSEINKNQTSELSDPQYSAASVLSDPATTDECDHTTPDHLDNVVLDMTGYKAAEDPDSISRSDEIVRDIIGQEFGDKSSVYNLFMPDHNENLPALASLDEGFVSALMSRSRPTSPVLPSVESSPKSQYSSANSQVKPLQAPPSQIEPAITPVNYVKTLRLTSVQLKSLNLNSGKNDISFRVNNGRAICQSHIYLWKADIPIVISDIDGTITKSDALGHMLAIIGRDWTHIGVAKLFTDIVNNGYNILYLTARSVGQADATRSYLNGVAQGGFRLPSGPVILSPDRTMAALKREVIMKKPEIFKMACLRDIKGLYNYGDDIYGNGTECGSEGIIDELYTPFYAGFGNRITDALSYRSVGIVSSRIFTINSYGDVHMELLELAGVKSSYVYITDLVDHFFPPVASLAAKGSNNYTDVSFWREPLLDLTDLEDSDAS